MGMTKVETKVEGEDNDKVEWMKVHVIFSSVIEETSCCPAMPAKKEA